MADNSLARPDGPGSTSLRSPEPEVSALTGDDPSRGHMQVILDWFAWLPPAARRGMSLEHLHVLFKRLRDHKPETPCPICTNARTYKGDPALSFCDEHYRQYLATFQTYPHDLAAFRAAVIAQAHPEAPPTTNKERDGGG